MSRINYTFLLLTFLFIILSFVSKIHAQLIVTGLTEDLERVDKSSAAKHSAYRTTATAAVVYSDTLTLPFFEDFTDVVVSIDSIVIDNTTDSLVRIYDNALNSYADGTLICAGFVNPSASTLTNRIARKLWYIKKTSANQFTLDSSSALTTPMKINIDTIIKNGFWRLPNRVYSTTLDTLKWQQGGNTYLNNRFPLQPVSYNVATFDGLMANGVPYNTVNVKDTGYADNLTSLPINLKPYSASDNIYLSFFWQQAGIGDVPESEDFLQLEFKDTSGVWNIVKTIYGNMPYMDTFKIEVIPVLDPLYFSKSFQFRFRSYGRLSGPFDIWNVDHIYLNKNRNLHDTTFFDKTIGNLPVTFLKHYTAMPYNQFFADTINESGNMVFTDNNLGRGLTDNQFFNVLADFTQQPTNITFSRDTTVTHYPGFPAFPNDWVRTFVDSCTPDVKTLTNNGQPFYIDQTFRIPSVDTSNILYANNNIYNTRTILWDYYSYDDGSPEAGIGANQIGAKFANMYTVKLSDTLTHIDLYFTRSTGPNMAGRSILLSVWDHNFTLVSQQTIQVAYGGYIRYKLNTPVIIGAGLNFYVGYQQNFVDLLTIGYDKNYDHSDKIFFNLGGSTWNAYNLQPGYQKGSLMIRAVFNKNQILFTPVITPSEKQLVDVVLFPVPTDNILKIMGEANEVTIYDFTGQKLLSQAFNPFDESKEIGVLNLANGLYIVEIKIKDQTLIKKIIIQHGN